MECLLYRVQRPIVGGEALDRGDLAAVSLHGQHRTALYALAVEEDRTSPAVGGVATDHRPDLAGMISEIVDEQKAALDVVFVPDAVDADADPGHCFLLSQGKPGDLVSHSRHAGATA